MQELKPIIRGIIAEAIQAEDSLQYITLLLKKIAPKWFIEEKWHSLLVLCLDMMKTYGMKTLEQDTLIRYIETNRMPLTILQAYSDLRITPAKKYSIHRLSLEIDIYLKDAAKRYAIKSLADKQLQLKDTYDDIRSEVMLRLNDIDRNLDQGLLPEANVMTDMREVKINYQLAKQGKIAQGHVPTSFPTIDEATGGLQRGDLAFILGYTGQGKSTVLLNIAYNAIMMGKNVIYFVNELQYHQLRLKLISRHTAQPQWWAGALGGVPSKAIELGQLTEQQEKILDIAINDMETKLNNPYGNFYISQLPSKSGLSYIESKMVAIQHLYPLDLCIIDDMRLCTADLKGETTTQITSKLIQNAKALAKNFNQGKGIPILAPWQVKRDAYEEALQTGEYKINCPQDSKEVENQADIMIWLLRTEELIKKNQILTGMLKNRMGALPEKFILMEQLQYSYISEVVGAKVSQSGSNISTVPTGEYETLLEEVLEI